MDKINVKQNRMTKKYTVALYEAAKNQGKTDVVFSDLNFVKGIFQSSEELYKFLINPIITQEDKKDVIAQIFNGKIEQITLNFLYLLADNARFELIFDIASEYANIVRSNSGIVFVKAVSAINMKDYLKEKLKSKLEQMLSKRVEIQYEINPEIIAGLIVEIDGKTIDNSISTKIKNIKKQLI